MQEGTRGREPEGASADGLVDQRAHGRDVVRRGRVLAEAAFTHGVHADRAMTDHAPDVQPLGPAFDRLEILAECGPVPCQPGHDAVGGNVLDRFHHFGQLLAIVFLAGRECHSTVAENDRRHAVPTR